MSRMDMMVQSSLGPDAILPASQVAGGPQQQQQQRDSPMEQPGSHDAVSKNARDIEQDHHVGAPPSKRLETVAASGS